MGTRGKTIIIPGHGPMSDKEELQAYYDMLVDVRAKVYAAVQKGNSLEEVQAAKPTARYDEELGTGFLTPEQFVSILFKDLSRKR